MLALHALVPGAYPVRKAHPLQTVNTEYLADLRSGLEEAGLYRHHDYPAPPAAGEDPATAAGANPPPIREDRPPSPCANFTLGGGLALGLRCGSGAVQTLAYNDSSHPGWWGNNFSFVPPLWNAYPPRAHRDQPGAHHVGDVTLLLQPISSANLSDNAFYSSSHGGAAFPATALKPADPLYPKTPLRVLAAADLTPTLLAPGQVTAV